MNNVTKKKTINKVLCYIGLVLLIVLLFLPPIFRLAFKEKPEEKVKDVVLMLSCEKANESYKSTFKNGEPQSVLYKAVGNYEVSDTEEQPVDTTTTETEVTTPQMVDKLKEYATFSYTENIDTSEFRVDIIKLANSLDYAKIFSSLENQESYLKSIGFSCSSSEMDY